MAICDANGLGTAENPGTTHIEGRFGTFLWELTGSSCTKTRIDVLESALCEVLTRRIDSISPDRALIGQPVDVVIRGIGFGTGNPTVDAGSGIGVVINSASGTQINARFNIDTNASAGNHGVSVTTSTGQLIIGGNFFVQVPTRLRRDVLGQTVVIDPGPGNVVNSFGVVTATNRCGGYRNVTYTLVDQQSQAILLAVPITETFDNYQGPPEIAPQDKTVFTLNGVIGDTLGLTGSHPDCPPVFSLSFNQRFRVDTSPSFQLSTVNAISMSKSSSGSYTISVNMTTP